MRLRRAELQRAEVLSIDKFLHLPVSVKGVFLINYLSSLLSVNLGLFLSAMLGFSLGLVFAKGPAMLVVLPLVAAFALAVTALTYQFQGWLASLMTNPRRRRAVIMVATLVFILVSQIPFLTNVTGRWGMHRRAERSTALVDELGEEVGQRRLLLPAKLLHVRTDLSVLERPDLRRDFRGRGVAARVHDGRDRGTLGAALRRVVGQSLDHQQRSHVGVTQAERAEVVGFLRDRLAGELGHVDADFEDQCPQPRGVGEGVHVEAGGFLVEEGEQVQG